MRKHFGSTPHTHESHWPISVKEIDKITASISFWSMMMFFSHSTIGRVKARDVRGSDVCHVRRRSSWSVFNATPPTRRPTEQRRRRCQSLVAAVASNRLRHRWPHKERTERDRKTVVVCERSFERATKIVNDGDPHPRPRNEGVTLSRRREDRPGADAVLVVALVATGVR